jgi:hypothetical protein
VNGVVKDPPITACPFFADFVGEMELSPLVLATLPLINNKEAVTLLILKNRYGLLCEKRKKLIFHLLCIFAIFLELKYLPLTLMHKTTYIFIHALFVLH